MSGGRGFCQKKISEKSEKKGLYWDRRGRIDIGGANERCLGLHPKLTTNGNTNPLHVVSNNVGNYRALMAA